MKNEIILVIARGLWAAYEMDLPDTPARVAKVIIAALEKEGLTINASIQSQES
jgi:hypothetical protein